MTLNSLAEYLSMAKDKAYAETGEEPDTVFIHPEKAKEIGISSGDEIAGLRVSVPTWEELGMLGCICGVNPRTKEMWNPEHVFILKDRITKKHLVFSEDT